MTHESDQTILKILPRNGNARVEVESAAGQVFMSLYTALGVPPLDAVSQVSSFSHPRRTRAQRENLMRTAAELVTGDPTNVEVLRQPKSLLIFHRTAHAMAEQRRRTRKP